MASPDDDQLPPALSTLQEAALQLLGAAKLFIAAAEQAVVDPKSLGRIGDVINGTVGEITRAAGRMVAPKSPPEDSGDDIDHIDLSD